MKTIWRITGGCATVLTLLCLCASSQMQKPDDDSNRRNSSVASLPGGSDRMHLPQHCDQRLEALPELAWTTTFRSHRAHPNDYGRFSGVDSSGNCFVVGRSVCPITGWVQAVVLKYSPSGGIVWWDTLDGWEPRGISVDPSGYLALCADYRGTGSIATKTAMYEPGGVRLWTAEYGPAQEDIPTSIAIDEQRGIYVVGRSKLTGGNYPLVAATIVRYNFSGDTLWTKQILGGYQARATSVITGRDGRVFVTVVMSNDPDGLGGMSLYLLGYESNGTPLPGGYSLHDTSPATTTGLGHLVVDRDECVYALGAVSGKGVLVKCDSMGVKEWLTEYETPNSTCGLGADMQGNLYIAAQVPSGTKGFEILKFDNAGQLMWRKSHDGETGLRFAPAAFAVGSAGEVYASGPGVGVDGHIKSITIACDSGGEKRWMSRLNLPADSTDGGSSLSLLPSGGALIAGSIYADTSGFDIFAALLDSSGTLSHTETWDGRIRSFGVASDVGLDEDGNAYVSGWTIGGGGRSDLALLRFDSTGTLDWYSTKAGQPNTQIGSSALFVSNGVFVTYSDGIVKFLDSGELRWRCPSVTGKIHHADGTGGIYSTFPGKASRVDSSGAVKFNRTFYDSLWVLADVCLATGRSNEPYVAWKGFGQLSLCRLDPSNGNILWRKDTPPLPGGQLVAAGLTNRVDGSLVLLGNETCPPTFEGIVVMVYDSTGDTLWTTRCSARPGTRLLGLDVTTDRNRNIFILAMESDSTSVPSRESTIILSLSESGKFRWSSDDTPAVNPGDKANRRIRIDNDGSVYSLISSKSQIGLSKYSPSGIRQWSMNFDGDFPQSSSTYGNSGIVVDKNGGFVLVSSPWDGIERFIQISRYVQKNPAVATPLASEVPSFALEQNYPNPFNPNTTITYALPRSSDVRLSVYDILGREVSVLVNERRDAGVHEVKFDGTNLASGVYMYRIQAGGFVQVKRLLLLR